MAALDISVPPSLGTDSSPAVLREALYLGKPVIASRIAGLPEIVGDGSGILVAPGGATLPSPSERVNFFAQFGFPTSS